MTKEQGRRLQLAREHAGYKSGRMAALRLGWKYPTYAAHESGLRSFPAQVAAKYARAFNVHPDYLIFGTRPPEWADATEAMTPVGTPLRYMAMFVNEPATEIEKWLSSGVDRQDFCIADFGNLPPGCFAMRVETDEMDGPGDGAVRRGDILIFGRDGDRPSPGALTLLHVRRQVAPSLRRVKALAGGKLRFVPHNENYEPLEDNDARVIGRAILHIRAM